MCSRPHRRPPKHHPHGLWDPPWRVSDWLVSPVMSCHFHPKTHLFHKHHVMAPVVMSYPRLWNCCWWCLTLEVFLVMMGNTGLSFETSVKTTVLWPWIEEKSVMWSGRLKQKGNGGCNLKHGFIFWNYLYLTKEQFYEDSLGFHRKNGGKQPGRRRMKNSKLSFAPERKEWPYSCESSRKCTTGWWTLMSSLWEWVRCHLHQVDENRDVADGSGVWTL